MSPDRLSPWMHWLLRFAGGYNIVAGLSMMIFYHEGFKAIGVTKSEFNLPIQLVGMLVAVFGVGYLIVDRRPLDNHNILALGFFTKLLGPLMAIAYIAKGVLPLAMLLVLFVSDFVYLVPFYLIYRRITAANSAELS